MGEKRFSLIQTQISDVTVAQQLKIYEIIGVKLKYHLLCALKRHFQNVTKLAKMVISCYVMAHSMTQSDQKLLNITILRNITVRIIVQGYNFNFEKKTAFADYKNRIHVQ